MATHRRGVLVGSLASFLLSFLPARARTIAGKLPWHPSAGVPPTPVRPGGWEFLSAEEVAAVEALVDRLIPPDPKFPGGKDAGCAVFIDRQLAGPYGRAEGLYMRGPFQDGTPQQGIQSSKAPAGQYRAALAALDKHCRATQAGEPFAALADDDKDKIIRALEDGSLELEGVRGSQFFNLLLQNTKEGVTIYDANHRLAERHIKPDEYHHGPLLVKPADPARQDGRVRLRSPQLTRNVDSPCKLTSPADSARASPGRLSFFLLVFKGAAAPGRRGWTPGAACRNIMPARKKGDL